MQLMSFLKTPLEQQLFSSFQSFISVTTSSRSAMITTDLLGNLSDPYNMSGGRCNGEAVWAPTVPTTLRVFLPLDRGHQEVRQS